MYKTLEINGYKITGIVGPGTITVSVQDSWQIYVSKFKTKDYQPIPELSDWVININGIKHKIERPKSWFFTF